MSYAHVIAQITCTIRLLTGGMSFCLDSSSEDEKKVVSKPPAKQPLVKNTSKPAKAAVKPGQAKKDSSSSSESSGIGIEGKKLLPACCACLNLCF